MKLAALLAATLTAALVTSAQAQIVIDDGDFSTWTFNATGTATVTREASGGNPGARLNITTISGPTVFGTGIKGDFSTSAALDGASFTLSLDVLSGPGSFGEGQAIDLLVEQNGTIYGLSVGITGFPHNFDTITFTGVLHAGSFSRLIGAGPVTPTFDGSVATRFGFAGGNAISGTLTQFYDNFHLAIQPPVCVAPPSALAAWWPGDGNANDIVGANQGSYSGAFAAGEVGQAFSLDGTDTVVITHTPALDFGHSDSFTVDAWIKKSAAITDTSGEMVLSLTYNCTPEAITLAVIPSGVVDFGIRDNLDNAVDVTSPGSVVDGLWHHLAGVRDVAAGKVRLYVDGVLVASADDTTTGTFTRAGAQDRIGSRPLCPTPMFFNGLIDEVEVFRSALTSADIAAIFNAGSAGKCKGCVGPPSGMAAWWPGDGNPNDISGNNNNGTLQGGATFAAGRVGQAFSLNGTSAYVEIPDSPSVSITGPLSIDAWINPNNLSSDQAIVSKYNSACPNPGTLQFSYILLVRPGGALRFCVYNGQPDAFHCVENSAPVIAAGVFSHVAGTFDPTTQAMKIYVNGVDTAAPVLAGSVTVNSIFDSDTPVDIGRVFCASESDFFGGLIDEVELFNRVLSAAEIAAIFNAGSAGKCKACVAPPSGLVSWWPGDGNPNDIIGGHNGTLSGGATFAAGEVASAFSFPTAGSVDIAYSTVATPAQITVDAWVNPASTPTLAPSIFNWRPVSNNTGVTLEQRFTADGTVLWNVFATGGQASVTSGTNTLPLNTWTHVAGTYDGITAKLYFNGVLVGSATTSGPLTTIAADAKIGRNIVSNGAFNGLIDEVEVFDRALTQQEIQAIYLAGSFGKCKLVIPTLQTSPNPTSGLVGATLNDQATLSGGSSPTGTITFKLFSPSDPTCAGTAAFTQSVTVSGNNTYSTSGGFVANTPGTWHWTATYSGDANNNPASSACAAEAVVISGVTPTLGTTPTPASGTAGVTALNDQATLSGGSSPTGTITFRLFSPTDPTCAGTAFFTQAVPVSGNSTVSTSGGPVANVAGTWHWTASYSGDANNNPVATACADEAVVISGVTPALGTTPTPASGTVGLTHLNDQATISNGASPTGTITFRLFSAADPTCAGTAFFTQAVTVSGNGTVSTSGGPGANAVGTWHWTASYSGDANNTPVSSACAAEPVVIGKALTAASTIPLPTIGTVGLTALNDSATLQGFNPTGTITFRLFGPGDPSCAGSAFFTQTVPVSGNGTVSTSGGPVANAAGTWQWTVSYSGDANNSGADSPCGGERVVVSAASGGPVPTLGEWGMIMMAAALAWFATRRMRRAP